MNETLHDQALRFRCAVTGLFDEIRLCIVTLLLNLIILIAPAKHPEGRTLLVLVSAYCRCMAKNRRE